MSILDQLARAKGRRDEAPNIELAAALAARRDKAAVAELAGALLAGPGVVKGDAIKVLYEVGQRDPALIAPHIDAFFDASLSKNNRLAWGALTALDTLAALKAAALCKRLPEILAAAEASSVIGKDRAVSILCKLTTAGWGKVAIPHLLAMLRHSAVNQLPMYAEQAAAVIPDSARASLRAVLTSRLKSVAQASKRARLEKVLRKLSRDR